MVRLPEPEPASGVATLASFAEVGGWVAPASAEDAAGPAGSPNETLPPSHATSDTAPSSHQVRTMSHLVVRGCPEPRVWIDPYRAFRPAPRGHYVKSET